MRTWVEKLGRKLKEATVLNTEALLLDNRKISIDAIDHSKLSILEIFPMVSYIDLKICEEEYNYLRDMFDLRYNEKQQELIEEFEYYE